MKLRSDIAVYSSDDQLQLVVEVRQKLGATLEWAARIRRDVIVQGAFSDSVFFLLVTPEYLYLWKKRSALSNLPDYQIELKKILGQYFSEPDKPMSEFSLHIAITSWLNNLITSQSLNYGEPAEDFICGSGLYSAIKNGSITTLAGL